MDSLGAGGRDVPEGQEDYYRQQLQEQRGGLPAMRAVSESASAEPPGSSQSDAGAGGGIDNKAESGKNNQADADPDAGKEDWEKKDSISQSSIAQRLMAKRMKALREKRKEQEAKAGVEEEAKEGRIPGLSQYRSARNKYKRIKNIIRIIKLVSAAGSSMGDIFISAGTFIITAHGELIYHRINPQYPFAQWEKWLIIAVDIIIFLILIIIAILLVAVYQLIDNPGGVLEFIS